MDALSALRLAGGSQLGIPAFDPSQEGVAAKSISLEDLQKFGPGITYQAPSSVPVPGSDSAASQIYSAPVTSSPATGSFQNLLGDFVSEVNAKQNASTEAVNGLLTGKNVSLHQAMISMEEASVSFQMMVEVRNKVLDSYQELMRMSV